MQRIPGRRRTSRTLGLDKSRKVPSGTAASKVDYHKLIVFARTNPGPHPFYASFASELCTICVQIVICVNNLHKFS
jgi:hypothetical protein